MKLFVRLAFIFCLFPISTIYKYLFFEFKRREQLNKELGTKGYKHKVQKPMVSDEDEEVLPNFHRIASLLKRWLLGSHQSYVYKNKLEYYLDENVFRYGGRTSTS